MKIENNNRLWPYLFWVCLSACLVNLLSANEGGGANECPDPGTGNPCETWDADACEYKLDNLKVSITPSTNPACVGQEITFTGIPNCDGGTYTWSGDVAGSGASVKETFDQPGQYTIDLDYEYNDVTASAETLTVTVEPLSATIQPSSTEPCINEEVTFTADVPCEGGTYTWSGDVSGSDASVTKTFDQPGEYTIKLNYKIDEENSVDASDVTITVQDYEVEGSVTPDPPCVGDSATLSATVNCGEGTFEWNTGDGTTSQEQSFSHVYLWPNSYTATVKYFIDGQEVDSDDVAIDVEEPTLDITTNPASGSELCSGDSVTFNANLSCGNTSYITWSGDLGASGTGASTNVMLDCTGSATVTATFQVPGGYSKTKSKTFTWPPCQFDCDDDGELDSCEPCGSGDPPEVELKFSKNPACDGEEVKVTIDVENSGQGEITSVALSATMSDGSTNYSGKNIVEAGIVFSQPDPNIMHKWQIDNARWFSTQANDCNEESTYHVTATVVVAGHTITIPGPEDEPIEFTVSASGGEGKCIYGLFLIGTAVVDYWDGLPKFEAYTYEGDSNIYVEFEDQESFKKNVKGRIINTTHPDSQFYDMIQEEEETHRRQASGEGDSQYTNDLWTTQKVMDDLGDEPLVFGPDKTEEQIYDTIATTMLDALQRVLVLDLREYHKRECDIETEAKNEVNATFRLKMECAYPNCN